MASWVEAGPGRRFVVAMASSNSLASIHFRSSTHRRRSRAMWVGGPPNPMHPRRSHSFPIVPRDTGAPGECSISPSSPVMGLRRLAPRGLVSLADTGYRFFSTLGGDEPEVELGFVLLEARPLLH